MRGGGGWKNKQLSRARHVEDTRSATKVSGASQEHVGSKRETSADVVCRSDGVVEVEVRLQGQNQSGSKN